MPDQGPRQAPASDAQRLTPSAKSSKPHKSSVPLRDLCGEPVAPWIPESKLPKVPFNSINSFARKILLATPEFPRFYADVVLATRPNSREARILRPHYQKILAKVNAMSNRSCTHIKVTGVRCGSPALRGEQFCYFHQNAHRGVRRPQQSRLHPIALIEDEESIQSALMEVINALMRNTIDVKRATLILRALHIAVKNASRVKFGILGRESVKAIPDYASPTPENEATAMQSELPAVSAIPYKPIEPTDPHFWERYEEGGRVLSREKAASRTARVGTDRVGTDRVGTGAFARPAQAKPSASVGTDCVGTDAPVRPGRAATVPAAAITTANVVPAAASVPPHNFKKPPTTANPAPHARKSAAHRASGG